MISLRNVRLDPVGRSEFYTVIVWVAEDESIVHKSMAPSWVAAVDLAMRGLSFDGRLDPDRVPLRLEVRRG